MSITDNEIAALCLGIYPGTLLLFGTILTLARISTVSAGGS